MSADTAHLRLDEADVDRILGARGLRWLRRHPRLIDQVVAVLCLAVQVPVLLLANPEPFWLSLLAALLSCAILLRRRFRPWAVLTGVVIVTTVEALCLSVPMLPGVLSLPAACVLFTLAALRGLPQALLGYAMSVAAGTAGLLVLFFLTGQAHAPSLLDPLLLLALALGIAARAAAQRREALAELMTERLARAQVLERHRITAEMHDVVAHSLSTMIALADGASDGWHTHPERSARALRRLGDVGRGALTDMRRILLLLRDGEPVMDDGLERFGHNLPGLEELAETTRHTGLPVRLTRTGGPMPDDPALAMTLYRIVQEALTNALRYATGASHVDVDIHVTDDAVIVRVADDGHADPAAPGQGSGRGLVGIAERAAVYGGSSSAGPGAREGWETRVVLHTAQGTRKT